MRGRKETLRLSQDRAARESCLLLAALGAGVAARGLAPGGQLAAVAVAAPGADVLEPLDIEGHLAHELAFRQFLLHAGADARLVGLAERVGLHAQVDVQLHEDALAHRAADALDLRQGHFDALIAGEDDARDTEHGWGGDYPLPRAGEGGARSAPGEGRKLSLSLLMLGILSADDAAYDLAPAVATEDEAAIFADRFAGGSNFHGVGGEETVGAGDCRGGAPLRPSVGEDGAATPGIPGEVGEKR